MLRESTLRVLPLLLLLPLQAHASLPALVTLSVDARSVSSTGSVEIWDNGNFIGCGPVETPSQSPPSDFSFFFASVAAGTGGRGSQTSSLTSTTFTGTGKGDGFAIYCGAYGYSMFEVEFRVVSPVLVHFSGELEADGTTTAQARLRKGADDVEANNAAVPFDHQSVLIPGDYTVTAIADAGGAFGNSQYTFGVQFIPATLRVPLLPPAAWAVMAMLIMAAGAAQAMRARSTRRARRLR